MATLDLMMLRKATTLKEEREINRHEKAMRKLNLERRALMGECKHEKRTFHPDPSGNNDSCYSCDACGLETRR